MRIGIYGGTFDPIHNGHLNAIGYAVDNSALDQIRVIVAGNPYQKQPPQANAKLRLEWAQIACGDAYPGRKEIFVDDREVKRPGNTYTIDTVRELEKEFPDSELILVVGEDLPDKIPYWKDGQELLKKVSVFVVPRSLFPASSSHIRNCFAEKKPLAGLLPDKIERDIREKALYNIDTKPGPKD